MTNTINALKQKPFIAWPTLATLLACWVAIIVSWTLVPQGIWPVWLGLVVNSIAGYLLFTPVHEGIHRSISRNHRLNDFLMAMGVFPATPFGRGRLFRFLHLRHHRFTNEAQDPDRWMASSLKTLPCWGLWPYFYVWRFLREPQLAPQLPRREVIRELLVIALVLLPLLLWVPYYMLMLWLIPTYIAFALMCVAFMVLPHYPHTGKQCDNPNHTSLMRMGQEWWLTPALMYQNYHLMHHLYPTIPFYRYGKAWRAREDFHQAHSSEMIIGPFALGPESGQ